MAIVIVTVLRVSAKVCECEQCEHIWIAQGDDPSKCARCKSRHWHASGMVRTVDASASAASAKPSPATRGRDSRLGQEKSPRLAGKLDAIAPVAGSKTGKTSELTYVLDE